MALTELEEYRTRDTYGGPGYAGYRDTRVFACDLDDAAAYEADSLAHGAVLPVAWGGVATTSPLDPRLHRRYRRQSKNSAIAEIVTEWVTITNLSPGKGDVWSDYEVSTSGGSIGGTNSFYGERNCVILDADVATKRAQYDPSIGGKGRWPGTTGAFAPWQSKYRLNGMPERAGCRMLTLIYTDPQPFQLLQPGRAVLRVRVLGTAKKSYAETTPHETDPLKKYVKTDTGGDVIATDAEVTIATVGTRANINAYRSRIGKVNKNTFKNIGNAPPRTMLFMGAEITGELIDRKYWQINYMFRYKPTWLDDDGVKQYPFGHSVGKNTFTKKILYVRPQEQNAAGKWVDTALPKQRMTAWVPDDPPTQKAEPKYPTPASFSDLDGMLSWY